MGAPPQLVFLYGPPAVGKLTVAEELAKRRPFRVLHNHVTIDAVTEILPFGTAAFWGVVGRFRRDLVAAAADEGIDLVYTYVFAPADEPHVDAIAAAYEEAGGTVTFVQLIAPVEELFRRVGNASRGAFGKITEPEPLQRLLSEHDVFASIPGRQSLAIDLGVTSASQAAELIVGQLDG
ncbi:MAG TPA: AAA family ATPase [Gaiellaceae bacterium]|nr:AAA family ATPase [Gaiellaceae bacterium]